MSTQTALPPDHDPLPPGTDLAALEPKKKKHKSGTLRRALSWLRGRKKKKPEAKQAESKENAKPDGQSQPIPPLEEESPDNAFFPSRRTAHLKNIHTQAQEGLKSLQRREKHHNKDQLQEDNTASENSTDASEEAFRTRSLSCSTENTDDAMSVRSEMIQRKGSTFRPYDSPNWSSNKPGRRRKEKRATVVGVPHHIAAELGLNTPSFHRGVHELFSKTENQPSEKAAMTPKVNGVQRDGEEYVVIPTVDGMPAETPRNGAHISLSTLEQTETALKRHIEKVYQDDSCIGWKTGQKISPLLIRPKSVAVPGMTTHSPQSDPVSPVMSISPQGTYMSKIIPNAVLPPLVDVVALTHSSVRTLSRCSLASASPASIRGSLRRGRGMSTSSDTWSRSQSTETIVSDSSTISSRGGENTLEVSEKNESGLSTGRASPALSTGTQDGSDAASLCSGRSSVRSVSLRKSRKAPPPPKRTYSLQQQREMGLPPRPEKKTTNKTSNARDPWVPRTDKTVENEVFHPKVSSPTRSDRTLSPSSGYSSQSGTPTLPVRSLLESPGTRRRTPPKPERSSLKSASSINASSSPSENNPTVFVSPPRAGSSKEDEDGQDIIPPHPNVPAPTCPPPTQSIDLLVTPVVTPAPSPPPCHHPTPPPVRKSESEAEIPPSALKEETVKESSWPPPPPEVPDIQDLSMADFPPPEDDLFLPPPPSMEPESARTPSQIDCINDSNETTEAEKPLLISKDETPLDTVKTQTNDVPLANTNAPETTVTDNSETPTKSVLDSKNDMQQPAVPPTSETAVLHSAADNSEELPEMVYKPHFVSTPSAEITESKEQLEVSVSQDTSVDSTTCKQESKVSTDNSVSPKVSTASTVSQSPVDSSLSVTPTSTVTPSIPLSPSSGSALPLSKVWKPVSAPSSRKLPNNQAIAAQPKEDASLPIVTPSLLQMVRLRSVQARGPQIPFSQLPSGIPAPQKPVRKSLSMRSSLGSDSSQGESPTQPTPSPQKPPDSPSNRSPASAASFVFARGSKKFVFEPPVSPEAESSLKRDLVAELKSQGGPRSPDGKPPIQRKPSKIPPPVARKPSVGIPRTPTTPSNATEGTSGNAVTPQEAVSVPPPSGTSASGTLENHEEQHKSRMEQA